jgi:uncharacterized membrane protein YhhN
MAPIGSMAAISPTAAMAPATPMLIATIVCALACALLVHAEWRADMRTRRVAKIAASAGFLVVGSFATRHVGGGAYATWILIGLAFGAIGDVVMLNRSTAGFLGGLVAFLIGHIAYVVAIAILAPPATWATSLAIMPLAAVAVTLRWLWRHLGGLRWPVVVYVGAITAMVIGALAVVQHGELASPHGARLAIGATLFFVSDLFVARERFVTRGVTNKAIGLPAYFAGQLLIAWSILGS